MLRRESLLLPLLANLQLRLLQLLRVERLSLRQKLLPLLLQLHEVDIYEESQTGTYQCLWCSCGSDDMFQVCPEI